MTSTVTEVTNLINTNYPVPGQDNDSQGFRSNFANIQLGFSRAANEITALQTGNVRLDTTNDFGNNIIKRASLQGGSDVVNEVGTISPGIISVDYGLGSYQQYTLGNGSYTFSVANWPPDGKCGTIRLELTPVSGTTATVDFSSVNIVSGNGTPIVYSTTTSVVWELWSPNNGDTVFAYELGFPSTGAASLTAANTFSSVQTFAETVTLQKPLQLAVYTSATTSTLAGSTGSIIFIGDAGKIGYHYNGRWHHL